MPGSEFSYCWTTVAGGTVGDQQLNASGYTQAMWSDMQMIMAGVMGGEGIAVAGPSFLANSLTMTGATTATLQLNTGGALVDGHPYKNPSQFTLTAVPNPVTFNRIDRFVLWCNWAGFVVRLTRVAGTEAASPTVPANPYTTRGSSFAILCYQALITPTGNVTLTDERAFATITGQQIAYNANITGGQIATGAITGFNIAPLANIAGSQLAAAAGILGSQIAAGAGIVGSQLSAAANIAGSQLAAAAGITDGQLVNSKISNRRGGNASSWATAGTNNYAPTASSIQVGMSTLPNGANAVQITFPVAFSNTPIVLVSAYDLTLVKAVCTATITSSSFYINTVDGLVMGADLSVAWIAIGPP